MIKYEHETLVLDSSFTKEDAEAINDFIEDIKVKERQKILQAVEKIEQQSHRTKTPLYQETLLKAIKEIVQD